MMDVVIPYFDILGVRISIVDPQLAFSAVANMIRFRRKGYICVAPVSTIVDAKRDPAYRDVVNAATMVTPDGAPVAWLGRFKGHREVRRTYGPDLMLKVCDEGRAKGFRHFFYGGTQDVCDKLECCLKEKFPGVHIVGKTSPPFMSKAEHVSPEIMSAINDARPDILWVGLGAPKQDFWMALNREALDVPVMVGIGAAFDFLAGVKPQAPQWMGRIGLEWLFRLCSEPRRLWRRYLIGNTLFVWWVIKEEVLKWKG